MQVFEAIDRWKKGDGCLSEQQNADQRKQPPVPRAGLPNRRDCERQRTSYHETGYKADTRKIRYQRHGSLYLKFPCPQTHCLALT